MISVVIATHNEEKNIKRCLSSVKQFAGEIILVDGDSVDSTREIARNLGAKVIKTSNKQQFHINKQMAMDQAKGELVLQLDADEEVDSELAKFIMTVSESPLSYIEKAWYVKRKNLFLGKFLTKGGQYPDPVIRLYVNGYARLPQKDVHEQMVVDGEIGYADGHLIHYANPSFSDYLRKWNTYTEFQATQLSEQKVKINLINSFVYLIWKPKLTFLSLFIRHKGFMDGIPGFVFALMSGLYHAMSYLKLWELQIKKKQ